MNKCYCVTCRNERRVVSRDPLRFAVKESEVTNIAMIDGLYITRKQAEKALAEMNKPDSLKPGDIIIYPGVFGVYRAVSYSDVRSLKNALEHPETYVLLVNDKSYLLCYDTIANVIKRRN